MVDTSTAGIHYNTKSLISLDCVTGMYVNMDFIGLKMQKKCVNVKAMMNVTYEDLIKF